MGPHDLSLLSSQSPLSARGAARLAWLRRHLPAPWLDNRRRRRILFLVLAAPGFLAVFATTYHHNFFVMLAGFALFGAAVAFRALTEPLFLQATADTFLPTPLPSHQKDSFDA
jgi:hypothetical protein